MVTYLESFYLTPILLLFNQKPCMTLCDPMISGFPILHYLPEFAQTHVHWVSDAIQPSHHLSLPSPALNLSQHQDLFQKIGSLHQVAKVLEFHSASASVHPMNGQGSSPLGLTSLISLLSRGLSKVFSNTTVQKHQFFGIRPFLWSNSYIWMRLLEKP